MWVLILVMRSLRELARGSGPAGSDGDGLVLASGKWIDEPSGEESAVDALRRHGSNAVLTLGSLTGLIEEEHERPRMRPGPRGPRRVAVDGGISPELLDDVRPIEDVHGRDPDMVLMDWMGDETGRTESDLFTDLNPTDEQIDYAVRKSRGEKLIPVVPEGMGRLRKDLDDYRRFGGDTVSMELDRSVAPSPVSTTVEEDDEILAYMTDTGEPYDAVADVDEAMGALREDLGSTARAVLRDSDGGRVEFDVDSPMYGRVRYVYDQNSGIGRLVGGE